MVKVSDVSGQEQWPTHSADFDAPTPARESAAAMIDHFMRHLTALGYTDEEIAEGFAIHAEELMK